MRTAVGRDRSLAHDLHHRAGVARQGPRRTWFLRLEPAAKHSRAGGRVETGARCAGLDAAARGQSDEQDRAYRNHAAMIFRRTLLTSSQMRQGCSGDDRAVCRKPVGRKCDAYPSVVVLIAGPARSPAALPWCRDGHRSCAVLGPLDGGRIHSRQLEVIDFLREEDRVLREQLGDGAYASPTTSGDAWPSRAGSSAVAGSASSKGWSHPTRSYAGTAS
jgi:hypothetical protein